MLVWLLRFVGLIWCCLCALLRCFGCLLGCLACCACLWSWFEVGVFACCCVLIVVAVLCYLMSFCWLYWMLVLLGDCVML